MELEVVQSTPDDAKLALLVQTDLVDLIVVEEQFYTVAHGGLAFALFHLVQELLDLAQDLHDRAVHRGLVHEEVADKVLDPGVVFLLDVVEVPALFEVVFEQPEVVLDDVEHELVDQIIHEVRQLHLELPEVEVVHLLLEEVQAVQVLLQDLQRKQLPEDVILAVDALLVDHDLQGVGGGLVQLQVVVAVKTHARDQLAFELPVQDLEDLLGRGGLLREAHPCAAHVGLDVLDVVEKAFEWFDHVVDLDL
mmetsp:Transcript_99326/g.214308  ORF Transcript_99326/g.214308 Transcript_99326/m.214308 type:complete len:250 (-) Transcript_99326:1830-2579(-)